MYLELPHQFTQWGTGIGQTVACKVGKKLDRKNSYASSYPTLVGDAQMHDFKKSSCE